MRAVWTAVLVALAALPAAAARGSVSEALTAGSGPFVGNSISAGFSPDRFDLDIGYDFGHIGDPLWFDVLRPTKLPAFPDEFGRGPRTFAGVRQTRFGTTWELPTSVGTVKGKF